MQVRVLVIAAALLALGGCETGPFNPFGGTKAGGPDAALSTPASAPVAAQSATAATPETDNREMSFFLRDNLVHMRKYPRSLRIVAVVGAQPMDLKSWPGALVADEIEIQAKKCGTPVEFVRLDQDFDLLVGFAHAEREGARDKADHAKIADALTRNRMRAAQSLADILDVELEVKIDTDIGSAKGAYPWDRWHQFLTYKVPEKAQAALLPRMPVETWREHYDRVVAEIGPMAPDSQAKRDRTEEFRSSYLNGVMAICPNNFFTDLLRRADVDVPPDLVTDVLRDARVREGMTREQFQEASLGVLNTLRPGK